MLAACGKTRTDPHTCDRLDKCIGKMGRRLDVKVSHVALWTRSSRKRVAQRLVNYPVLLPSDWVNLLFSYGGHFFLGGRSLASPGTLTEVETELEEFWSRYHVIDKDFPMFQTVPKAEWKRSIPIALHGDEGRGKAKSPVMVMSIQCILPLVGKQTNMQGFPGFLKRSSVSSFKELSMHPLALGAFACTLHDCKLFQAPQGFDGRPECFARGAKCFSAAQLQRRTRCHQVQFDGEAYFFRFVMLGTKGDWPFLRAAYALNNGYNCRKKCHLCEMDEAGLHTPFLFS